MLTTSPGIETVENVDICDVPIGLSVISIGLF